MPDIDLDFPDDRRGEMIDYTVRKYGQDNVAQIITFGTLGARAAVRDVGRVMDIPLTEVDRVARLIPSTPGKPISIAGALEQVPELQDLSSTTPYIQELLDVSSQLEGVARHASTHAAGVVITDAPLVEYCPLNRPTRGESAGSGSGQSSEILGSVTQWPMEDLDEIGLLKVDFLGLRTLTVMNKACELIYERHGIKLDLDSIPLDDPESFALLSSGEVAGVFQVEGTGFRRVLREMRPSRYEHIVAVLALYRPGPMEHIPDYIQRMHGVKAVEYLHPSLASVLDETFGIIVFQEQIIQLASTLAGYEPGEADMIRKAVGKKKKKDLLAHRTKFVEGCVANEIAKDTAEAIFADIEYFARYGFNKSHAADYAVLTCQTAYLKAHYPLEYMAALLTAEQHNTDKVGMIVAECRRMGITVLQPDINHSEHGFTIEGDAVRFGLGAVKNVGDGPVAKILEGRGEQLFRNLQDFCQRVDLRMVNRRALESLIRVGALESMGPRTKMLAALDRMMGISSRTHQAREIGQMSMFGEQTGIRLEGFSDILAGISVSGLVSSREMLEWEKELTGTYISHHPLTEAMNDLGDIITAYAGQLDEEQPQQVVTVLGMVRRVRRHTTRRGDLMAFVTLEDLHGTCDVVVFPRVWEKTRDAWLPDRIVVVSGKVNFRNDSASLICEWVKPPREVSRPRPTSPPPQAEQGDDSQPVVQQLSSPTKPRFIRVTISRTGNQERDFALLAAVHELLVAHPGSDRFVFVLQNGPNGDQLLEFPNDSTNYSPDLGIKLTDLVGPGAVQVGD